MLDNHKISHKEKGRIHHSAEGNLDHKVKPVELSSKGHAIPLLESSSLTTHLDHIFKPIESSTSSHGKIDMDSINLYQLGLLLSGFFSAMNSFPNCHVSYFPCCHNEYEPLYAIPYYGNCCDLSHSTNVNNSTTSSVVHDSII